MVSRYHDYKGVALLTKILGSIPSYLQLSEDSFKRPNRLEQFPVKLTNGKAVEYYAEHIKK